MMYRRKRSFEKTLLSAVLSIILFCGLLPVVASTVKLSEIANLIENMLKRDGNFITPDYYSICFDYISNETVTSYRKKMQCFRHATNEAILERNSYSEKQKSFFVDFGLTIIKLIYNLIS